MTEPFYTKVADLSTENGDLRLRRLSFLPLTLRKYDIKIKDVTAKMGVNISNWRYWMKNDDIFLSRIYQIADACDLNIRFLITQKELLENISGNRGRCLTEIHSTSVSDISSLTGAVN